MSPRTTIRCALAAALFATALPAAAARLELQAGRSYMSGHGTNAAFVEAVFAPQPLGGTGLTWSPDVSLGWIDGRRLGAYGPARYARYDNRDSVALLAGGARFHLGQAGDWYQPLFFSEQLAATDRTTYALSSHYQFVSTVGWQGKHFSVALRHISNGALHLPNAGETMALVAVAFDI